MKAVFLPLCSLLILQSCSSLIDTNRTEFNHKVVEAKPGQVADPAGSTPMEPTSYSNFSIDTLYSLMVAEIAASRKQYDITLNNYISEAKATGDLGVISRATRLAQYFRKHNLTLEMGKAWLDLEPENLEANALVATAYIEQRQPLKALNHAEVILKLINPNSKTANRSAAITETIANFSTDTDTLTLQTLITRFQQLSQQYPKYPSILVGLSTLYESQKDTAKAYQVIKEALNLDDRYMPALMQEVRLLQSSDQVDLALEKLKAHLTDQPDDYRIRLLYARLLTQSDINAAYTEFTILSEQSPKHLDIKFSRALVALELQKRAIAEQLFKELLAVNYRPNTMHFYLGNLAELSEDLNSAVKNYLAIDGGDDYFAAHSRAARIMAQQGSMDRARNHFKQLRQESPDRRPRLYMAEAEVMEALGKLDLALETLTEAASFYPDNTDIRYNRSSLYEQNDQLALMESDLRHILTLEPDNSAALNALGYFLTTRTTRYSEALELIKKAINLKPDDPAILDSMGWVLFKLGRTDEAINYLRKAFELFPDPEVAAHLGEALWVKGNKQEARSIWDNNLKEHPNDSRILDTMERLKVEE